MSDWEHLDGPGVLAASTTRSRWEEAQEAKRQEGVMARDRKRRERWANRKKPLIEEWVDLMRVACFGKQASYLEHRAMMRATLNRMRDEGYSEEDILAMMQRFAELVKGEEIDVRQKSAWRVFLARRTQLAAALKTRVSSEAGKTADDWKL